MTSTKKHIMSDSICQEIGGGGGGRKLNEICQERERKKK